MCFTRFKANGFQNRPIIFLLVSFDLLTEKVSLRGKGTDLLFPVGLLITAFVVALHAFWELNLIRRNREDWDEEVYYAGLIRTLGFTTFPTGFRSFARSMYSPLTQLGVTLIFSAFVVLVVWYRTHQPPEQDPLRVELVAAPAGVPASLANSTTPPVDGAVSPKRISSRDK